MGGNRLTWRSSPGSRQTRTGSATTAPAGTNNGERVPTAGVDEGVDVDEGRPVYKLGSSDELNALDLKEWIIQVKIDIRFQGIQKVSFRLRKCLLNKLRAAEIIDLITIKSVLRFNTTLY